MHKQGSYISVHSTQCVVLIGSLTGAHRAGKAGEGACNLYKQQNSNMAANAKISNIHIWHLWGNPQAEGNVKLGFHTSASLTAVS